MKDLFTFLVGGRAGEGIKKAGSVAANRFASLKRHVFQMDDYQSLIRGGHNFSVVSTSTERVRSHYMKADLLVLLDQRSYDEHKGHLSERSVVVYNSDRAKSAQGVPIAMSSIAKGQPNPDLALGVGSVAVLLAATGMDRESLAALVKREYPGDGGENLAYAEKIFTLAAKEIGEKFRLREGDRKRPVLGGNEAIALGAVAGGLDIYYSYPMTPTTGILHFLARRARELGVVVVHPENEIAVVNMAIGSAFSGARSMVGSSGGGHALMEEGFSLAGMLEAPLLTVLSSRPGPSTGVPTQTEQADLMFALNQGHGDFPKIVASPGSFEEAFQLAARMLELVWRFQTPGILLTEKHLSESSGSVDIRVDEAQWAEPKMHSEGEYRRYEDTESGVSPLLFPPSQQMIKWNSYEHDERGITTEKAELVARMHEKRQRKRQAIVEGLKKEHTVNVHCSGGCVVFAYGSTTMSVLEALEAGGLEATVVQPMFLEPLPVWELDAFNLGETVVVEQSCSGQFARLLAEKAGIEPVAVIKKYDGRPFEPEALANELGKVIGHG